MRPRLFLRTTEFLWQEGHTVHETGGGGVRSDEREAPNVHADSSARDHLR